MAVHVCNIVAIGKAHGVDFLKAFKNRAVKKSKVRKREFYGCVIKLEGLATCLLFPNGAITVVGIKNQDHLGIIEEKLIQKLPSKCDGVISLSEPLRICNIVGHCKFRPIDIPQLYNFQKHTHSLMYVPEHFPGLKISLSLVTAIVFHTGKVIFTGAKKMQDLKKSHSEFSLILTKMPLIVAS